MRLKVTMTKSEIQTAIQQYLVKCGLRIDDIETIVNETGQEVCQVNKPIPPYATQEAMEAHSVLGSLGREDPIRKVLTANDLTEMDNHLNMCCEPYSRLRNIPSEYKNNVRVTFIVDTSASMDDHETIIAVHRLINEIKNLHKDVYPHPPHYNYISYSSEAHVVERQEDLFTYDHQGTNINKGLKYALGFGDTDLPDRDYDRYTYLITDGDMDQNEFALDETSALLSIIASNSTLSVVHFLPQPYNNTLSGIMPDSTIFATVPELTKHGVAHAMHELTIENPLYSPTIGKRIEKFALNNGYIKG